jgi:hypothetical protein
MTGESLPISNLSSNIASKKVTELVELIGVPNWPKSSPTPCWNSSLSHVHRSMVFFHNHTFALASTDSAKPVPCCHDRTLPPPCLGPQCTPGGTYRSYFLNRPVLNVYCWGHGPTYRVFMVEVGWVGQEQERYVVVSQLSDYWMTWFRKLSDEIWLSRSQYFIHPLLSYWGTFFAFSTLHIVQTLLPNPDYLGHGFPTPCNGDSERVEERFWGFKVEKTRS